MKQLFIFLIKFYQNYIRWVLPRHCRFYPSCSDYCLQAIEEYGIIFGLGKGIKRLIRCNPIFPGGLDPLEHRKVR